jgi:hypothetical protein
MRVCAIFACHENLLLNLELSLTVLSSYSAIILWDACYDSIALGTMLDHCLHYKF